MTAGLMRAEWVKLRKMRLTWLALIIPAVLALLGSILTAVSAAEAIRQFGGVAGSIVDPIAFPQPLLFGLQLVDFLGTILIVIFTATVVGNEYGFDTWKNLLTRRAERSRFLLVKLAAMLAESTLLVLLVPALFQIGLILTLRSLVAAQVPLNLQPGELQTLSAAFLVSWLRLAVAASLGLLAATVTRSTGSGITVAVPWLLADSIVNGLAVVGGTWRDLARLTFNFNLNALAANLRGGTGEVTLVQSLAVLAVYTLGVSALAIMLFRRRDIAG